VWHGAGELEPEESGKRVGGGQCKEFRAFVN